MKLESIGIAAIPVATREFMTAARAQAAALGRADLDAIYVEHPIQDQTPQEIAADPTVREIYLGENFRLG